MVFLSCILSMSLTATVAFFLLKLMVNMTSKIFSAAWHYAVTKFLIVLFLFPIPKLIEFPIHFPFMNTESIANIANNVIPVFQESNNIEEIGIVKQNVDVWGVLIFIWLLGVIIFTIWQIVSYSRFRRVTNKSMQVTNAQSLVTIDECKKQLHIKNVDVLLNPDITTPMLTGVLFPKILLPTDISTDGTNGLNKYVLQHEFNHYKKKDLWIKTLFILINAIHWFNPVVYFARKELDKWCELACDETVAMDLDNEQRKLYGLSILNSIKSGKIISTSFSSMFSTKNNLKRRIDTMLNLKRITPKNKLLSAALAVVFVAGTSMASFPVLAVSNNSSQFVMQESVRAIDNGTDYSIPISSARSANNAIAVTANSTPALAGTSIINGLARGNVPYNDTTIGYNTEIRFTNSSDGWFIIRKGVTATFTFDIKSGNENVEVSFKTENGTKTSLFNGSTNGTSVSYTATSDTTGCFYVWNKAATSITLTDIKLSY